MMERSGVDVTCHMTADNPPAVSDLDLSKMTLIHYFSDVTAYKHKDKTDPLEYHFFGGKSGGAGAGTTGFAIFGNVVDQGVVVHMTSMVHMSHTRMHACTHTRMAPARTRVCMPSLTRARTHAHTLAHTPTPIHLTLWTQVVWCTCRA